MSEDPVSRPNSELASPSASPWSDATRVDLGDDLLQESAPQAPTAPLPLTDLKDDFQSAEILFNEGFLEEAKQTLRKILLRDSNHFRARNKLHEIHERELQDILAGRENLRRKPAAPPSVQLGWDVVAEALEKDLGLLLTPLELLQNAAGEEIYAEELTRQLRGSAAQDWIDAGIGFLQMGMGHAAAALFKQAGLDEGQWIEAQILEAQAWVCAGQWAEAALALQKVLPRVEASGEPLLRTEVLYWLGRVEECAKNFESALGYYRAAIEVDATHRDLLDRVASLMELRR